MKQVILTGDRPTGRRVLYSVDAVKKYLETLQE